MVTISPHAPMAKQDKLWRDCTHPASWQSIGRKTWKDWRHNIQKVWARYKSLITRQQVLAMMLHANRCEQWCFCLSICTSTKSLITRQQVRAMMFLLKYFHEYEITYYTPTGASNNVTRQQVRAMMFLYLHEYEVTCWLRNHGRL